MRKSDGVRGLRVKASVRGKKRQRGGVEERMDRGEAQMRRRRGEVGDTAGKRRRTNREIEPIFVENNESGLPRVPTISESGL